MAQKQLSVILTTPVQNLEAVLKNLDEHLKFQVELERRGIKFAAGPFWDDDETHCAARAIAAEDPIHKSGARRFMVRPWLPNEGTLALRLNFSDMKARLE